MENKNNSSNIDLDGSLQKVACPISESLARVPRAVFLPDSFAAPGSWLCPPEISWVQPHSLQEEAKDAQGRLTGAIYWAKFPFFFKKKKIYLY